MPEWMTAVNFGLVGVLGLFVWRLPEMVRGVLEYLAARQLARDKEFDKLGEIFRNALTSIMVEFRDDRLKMVETFKADQQREREQSQQQFERVIEAVNQQVCGFVEHHTAPVVSAHG